MADFDMNGHPDGDVKMDVTEVTENTTTVNEEDDEDDRKLFIGGLSLTTKEEGLRKYCESWGEIDSIEMKMNRNTGVSRCFAFVVFKELASVQSFLAETTHTLDGKTIDPKIATKQEDATKIFVGGLHSDTTDDELRSHFGQFGTISDMSVPVGPDNSRRTYAFIVYTTRGAVAKATKDRMHTVHGKECEVKKSVPRGAMRGGRGMYGGRGGRGFSRGSYDNYGSYGGYNQGNMNYGNYANDYNYFGSYDGWGNWGGYDQNYGYSGYDQSGFGKSRGRGGRGYRPY